MFYLLGPDMIASKKDLNEYLLKDKCAIGIAGLRNYLFDDIWQFQRLLRRAEYWSNCSKGFSGRIVASFYRHRMRCSARKLGFSIPLNVFGPGLSIAHAGTIVVNSKTKVGANCRLHVCVNIGASASDSNLAPNIGDDCYIAPGAKIYGDVTIGPNTGIGANAVVNKSFPDGNQTIAGVPARQVSQKGPLEYRPLSASSKS